MMSEDIKACATAMVCRVSQFEGALITRKQGKRVIRPPKKRAAVT